MANKSAGKTQKKMGRPRVEINFDLVNTLAEAFCTCEEIVNALKASGVQCSHSTVDRRIREKTKAEDGEELTFDEYIRQRREGNAKPKLRKAQFDCALGGNATMLIWLGKQYLGQVDRQEMKIEGGETPVEIKQTIDKVKAMVNDNQ